MAKKIAISTHKGGVGKTATALALAAGFAHRGLRTLLVDLDPQGHCSPGLGVELTEPTLKQFFEGYPSLPLSAVIRSTYLDKLDIAPSDLGLSWVAEGLSARPKRDEFLARSLRSIEKAYDWVVMDCPPSLGVLTQNAVTAADFVVIPTSPDARTVNAIQDLLDVVQLMKGESYDAYGILLTRVDNRKSKTNSNLRASLAPWHEKLFATVIPQSEPLNQAQMASRDIYTFDAASAGAVAYGQLINELLETL